MLCLSLSPSLTALLFHCPFFVFALLLLTPLQFNAYLQTIRGVLKSHTTLVRSGFYFFNVFFPQGDSGLATSHEHCSN